MLKPTDFFEIDSLSQPLRGLFDESSQHVWEVLPRLKPYLTTWLADNAALHGQVDEGAILVNADQIYLGPDSHVEAGAYIAGPAYIGAGCEVRHGAYVRGVVMAGERCILGHASEFKNVLMLPESKAGHFAYVGDSILGWRVNLGAGTKLANLEIFSDAHKEKHGYRPTVRIRLPDAGKIIDTGLTKLGAILGDDTQTGCNSVTSPGCLTGQATLIYPNVSVPKGVHPLRTVVRPQHATQIMSMG